MSGQWHGGKGSATRRSEISQQEWDNRWDNIFGKDKPKAEPMSAPGTIGGAKVILPEDILRSNEETQEALLNSK